MVPAANGHLRYLVCGARQKGHCDARSLVCLFRRSPDPPSTVRLAHDRASADTHPQLNSSCQFLTRILSACRTSTCTASGANAWASPHRGITGASSSEKIEDEGFNDRRSVFGGMVLGSVA